MPVFDKQTLQEGATRPLYASVGVTDLAVEAVREALADLSTKTVEFGKDAQKNLTAKNLLARDLKADAKALGDQARKAVETVSVEAKNAPERVQKFVESNVATAAETYSDLVVRGEGLVKRIRNQGSTQDAVKATKTAVAKAKATKTTAAKTAKTAAAKKPATKKPAAKRPSTATKTAAAATRSNAKATVTAAKTAASAGVEAVVDAAAKIGD